LLTYKVATIEGFSIFCDWNKIDIRQNGGIDIDLLRDKTLLPDSEDMKPLMNLKKEKLKKKIMNTRGQAYFYQVLKAEFSDD